MINAISAHFVASLWTVEENIILSSPEIETQILRLSQDVYYNMAMDTFYSINNFYYHKNSMTEEN